MTVSLEAVLAGKLPPWLARFEKQVGRGMHRASMLKGGEKVLLGISGGKDSLSLALALRLRRRILPVDIRAALVDWKEYPLRGEDRSRLDAYFRLLGIPLVYLPAAMIGEEGTEEFNCYLCSRRRKKVLFEHMEREGLDTLALGHHLDDFAETLLMNLAVKGECVSMKPVQTFFDDRFRIIRPLCEVREETVRLTAKRLDLPVTAIPCPYQGKDARATLKPVVSALTRIHRQARENMYRAGNGLNLAE